LIFPRKGATCLAGVQTFLIEKGNQREVPLMDNCCQEMGIIKGNINSLRIINTKGINKVLWNE